MKVRIAALLLAILAPCLWAIDRIDQMEEVGERLKEADSKTLVVWDVDMVLIQPKEPAFQMGNMGCHSQAFRNLFFSLDPDEQAITLSLVTLESEAGLLDPKVTEVLQNLRFRQVPHVALTACLTGPLAECASLENERLARLGKLGIRFTNAAPLKEDTVFEEMPSYRGSPVIYKEGVIFANGAKERKGKALVLFPINPFHLDRHLLSRSIGFWLANQEGWLRPPTFAPVQNLLAQVKGIYGKEH